MTLFMKCQLIFMELDIVDTIVRDLESLVSSSSINIIFTTGDKNTRIRNFKRNKGDSTEKAASHR